MTEVITRQPINVSIVTSQSIVVLLSEKGPKGDPAIVYSSEDVTIASGIITITNTGASEYHITLSSWNGLTDSLFKVVGLNKGDKIIFKVTPGQEPISIVAGDFFYMPVAVYSLSGHRTISFISEGDNICSQLSQSSNN